MILSVGVGHEVLTSDFIDHLRQLFRLAQFGCLVAPWSFQAQRRPFLPVQAVNPRVGDFLDAHLQRRRVLLDGFVQVSRGRHLHDAQRISLAESETLHQCGHKPSPPRRSQSFFSTTACSMTLSKLKSDTICLSLRFSASRWCSRRNSDGHTPPYFLR